MTNQMCARNLPQHFNGCACSSANRDGGESTGVRLLADAPVVAGSIHWPTATEPFNAGDPTCLRDVGADTFTPVTVVADNAAMVTVQNEATGSESTVPRHLLADVKLGGREVPVSDLEDGHWVNLDGRLVDVTEIEDTGEELRIEFDDGDEVREFAYDANINLVGWDDSRYLTEVEGRAFNPENGAQSDFHAKFTTTAPPGDSTSDTWDSSALDSIPADRIWTQYEGLTDDGRYTYSLIPGYDRHGINHVVTNEPWTDEQQTYDWN